MPGVSVICREQRGSASRAAGGGRRAAGVRRQVPRRPGCPHPTPGGRAGAGGGHGLRATLGEERAAASAPGDALPPDGSTAHEGEGRGGGGTLPGAWTPTPPPGPAPRGSGAGRQLGGCAHTNRSCGRREYQVHLYAPRARLPPLNPAPWRGRPSLRGARGRAGPASCPPPAAAARRPPPGLARALAR